jgi:hypothetical protein
MFPSKPVAESGDPFCVEEEEKGKGKRGGIPKLLCHHLLLLLLLHKLITV